MNINIITIRLHNTIQYNFNTIWFRQGLTVNWSFHDYFPVKHFLNRSYRYFSIFYSRMTVHTTKRHEIEYSWSYLISIWIL